MRLAVRTGHIHDLNEWIDSIPPKTLRELEALSLLDDWSGEHQASLEYRRWWLLLRMAAAQGVKIDPDDEIKLHEFLPLRVKETRRPENNVEDFRKFAEQRYG